MRLGLLSLPKLQNYKITCYILVVSKRGLCSTLGPHNFMLADAFPTRISNRMISRILMSDYSKLY